VALVHGEKNKQQTLSLPAQMIIGEALVHGEKNKQQTLSLPAQMIIGESTP